MISYVVDSRSRFESHQPRRRKRLRRIGRRYRTIRRHLHHDDSDVVRRLALDRGVHQSLRHVGDPRQLDSVSGRFAAGNAHEIVTVERVAQAVRAQHDHVVPEHRVPVRVDLDERVRTEAACELRARGVTSPPARR